MKGLRAVLVGVFILMCGLIYGFAGTEEEWGSIHFMGMVFLAILCPWELLFLGKWNSKKKK